jgi:NifU-like protein
VLERLSPEHLRRVVRPVGLGDVVPADLGGESGSAVGGGGARVTLRLDEATRARVARGDALLPDATVRAAAFRPVANAAARAPGSVLVELVSGRAVAAARRVTLDDLVAPLGVVPPGVLRAAARLVEALHRAIDDGRAAARADASGLLVCRCLGIGDRVVRRAIRRGADDVPTIGIDCAAGTGCHSCWPDLRALLDEEHATHDASRPVAARAPADDAPVTLARAVDAIVRPLWRAQGVALGAVAVDGETVSLAVERVEPGALASPIGAVALAQYALRESLSETVRVAL